VVGRLGAALRAAAGGGCERCVWAHAPVARPQPWLAAAARRDAANGRRAGRARPRRGRADPLRGERRPGAGGPPARRGRSARGRRGDRCRCRRQHRHCRRARASVGERACCPAGYGAGCACGATARAPTSATTRCRALSGGPLRRRARRPWSTWPASSRRSAAPPPRARAETCPTGRRSLVGQQSLHDPTHAPESRHTRYHYGHVPARSALEDEAVVDRLQAQIERFAPGFSARIPRGPSGRRGRRGARTRGLSAATSPGALMRSTSSSSSARRRRSRATARRCAGCTRPVRRCIPAARCRG